MSNPPAFLNSPAELYAESRIYNRPLVREPKHFTFLRKYVQNLDYFDPSAKALGTPDSIEAEAYLVERLIDSVVQKVVWFHELFANIPESWNDEGGTIISQPEISGAGVMAATKTIISWNRIGGSLSGRRVGCTSHGYSNNDRVRIEGTLLSTGLVNGIFQNKIEVVAADYKISNSQTNTFDILFGGAPDTFTYTFTGTVSKYTSGLPTRKAGSLALSARVNRQYFFAGISPGITTQADIPKVQPFRPILDASGFLSTTSTPTAASYLAWVDNNYELVSESAPEKYIGPLVCLRTLYYVPV